MRQKKDYLPMWKAMLEGQAEIVEVFIGLGADPNLTNKMGFTFLHLAASQDSLKNNKVAEVLIRHGAEINRSSTAQGQFKSVTPFQVAVTSGNLKISRLFLENGASLDWCEVSPGELAFQIKDDSKCREMLLLLAEYGLDAKFKNIYGFNLLHSFLKLTQTLGCDRVPVAETLLDIGVPLDEYDHKGFTPLHQTIGRKNTKLAALFIERGANVNMKCLGMNQYPLFLAAMEKDVEHVKLFLSSGVNINATDDENRFTALHAACLSYSEEIISLLIQKGADICAKENRNMTPFLCLNPDNRSFYQCARPMIKEFAKWSFENKSLDQNDLYSIKQDSRLHKLFKSCKSELVKMSNTTFYSFLTFYSVLKMSKDVKILANIVKKEKNIKAFESKLSLFPHYSKELLQVLEAAVIVRDEERIETQLVYARLKGILNNCIPDLVIRNLIKNLTLKDLPLQ